MGGHELRTPGGERNEYDTRVVRDKPCEGERGRRKRPSKYHQGLTISYILISISGCPFLVFGVVIFIFVQPYCSRHFTYRYFCKSRY